MPRILVVTPHFPPVDTPDMHRVRTTVAHYQGQGWEPVVLAVKPEAAGRLVEPALVEGVPPDVEVVRTDALPLEVTRAFGVTAIGARAYFALDAAGARLIDQLQPEIAFFSTTAFPVMTLGPRWKQRFGLKYVLDIQDPWFTRPPTSPRAGSRGLKAALASSIHARLEAFAMSRADGLIAVSGDYLEALGEAYPRLSAIPKATVPIGYSSSDFLIAERCGQPVDFAFDRAIISAVFTGAVPSDMAASVRTLFAALASHQGGGTLLRLHLGFVGTSYFGDGARTVTALAHEFGLTERVVERAERVSLYDALRTLTSADVLLIFGSDDLAYQPSKLFQYLATNKPILCVARRNAQFLSHVKGIESVFHLDVDEPHERALEDWMTRFAGKPAPVSGRRRVVAEKYCAEALAVRECALFDAVVSHSGSLEAH